MLSIKFSHKYPKLHGQTSAELIKVSTDVLGRMAPQLVEYDTRYYSGENTEHYPLSGYFVMVLYFIGNYGIPFTTIRGASNENQKHYLDSIGETFKLVVTGEINKITKEKSAQ